MAMFGIQVVRAQDFDRTIAAANDGVELAQRFVLAFIKWSDSTDDKAYCFACELTIRPKKNFGGLANGYVDETGLLIAGAFCDRCESKAPQGLAKLFVERINAETRFECTSVH